MSQTRKPTVVIKRFGRRPNEAQVRRAARWAVRRLGGMGRFVRRSSRVMVKPNLGSPARHTTGCVTDMRVLETTLALVKEARPREVFMAEGALMGGLGGALGAGLGAALTAYMGTIEFEFREATEVTHLPVTWNWIHYAIAVGLALATAALAGYLPARRAAQGNPVDIIRGAT